MNGDEESGNAPDKNLRKLKMNIENSFTQLQTKIKQLDDMKNKIGVQNVDGHRYRNKV